MALAFALALQAQGTKHDRIVAETRVYLACPCALGRVLMLGSTAARTSLLGALRPTQTYSHVLAKHLAGYLEPSVHFDDIAQQSATNSRSWEYAYCDSTALDDDPKICLLYTSPSPRDGLLSRMPSSA